MIHNIFIELIQFESLMAIILGALIGVVIGALPGLSVTMALALMIPVTFLMDPIPGLLLLVSVYTAGVYGGTISAVLLYTPGTPANGATSLDGYPMTKAGKGFRAITIATVSSIIGGLFGGVALLLFAPLLSRAALAFGPHEYFLVAVLGLLIIGGVAGKSLVRGILAALLGLAISLIGIDGQSGNYRLTFGVYGLQSGVEIIPAMIGLFAVAQLLVLVREPREKTRSLPRQEMSLRKSWPSGSEWLSLSPVIGKSSVIGTGVGILPGAGGDIASWVAYNEAKRSSKNPERFGHGSPAGIAAPESANNAVVGGALIPTMTLGIPGSTATAVLLGGLIMNGLAPGHQLFTTYATESYTIIVGFMVATVLMGLFGLGLARGLVRAIAAPPAVLVAVIMVFSTLGTYAIRNNMFDVAVMLVFGGLGYGLRTLSISPAPVILGLILGPIAEQGFRQSEAIAGDSSVWLTFLDRPISLVLVVVIFMCLCVPTVKTLLQRIKKS